MQTIHPLEIVLLVSAALAIATVSVLLTAAYYRQRIHRVYSDAWRAARAFYRSNPPA
jgi:hypothetical protein